VIGEYFKLILPAETGQFFKMFISADLTLFGRHEVLVRSALVVPIFHKD